MDLLRRFNGDKATKEALREYLLQSINEDALKRMYAGEDVSHIKDAVDLLNSSLEKLDILFEIPHDNVQATNQAR